MHINILGTTRLESLLSTSCSGTDIPSSFIRSLGVAKWLDFVPRDHKTNPS